MWSSHAARLHLLHRFHKWLHLGYLGCIVLDQHIAHVVTAGAMFSLGAVIIFLGDELEQV